MSDIKVLEQRIQRLENLFEALGWVLWGRIVREHNITMALFEYLHSEHPRKIEDYMVLKMDELECKVNEPDYCEKTYGELVEHLRETLTQMKQKEVVNER